jgi:hypothetical protein
MTVAGTEGGAPVRFTIDLPSGWSRVFPHLAAEEGDQDPPPRFFASVVDNTFSDPCAHIPREPQVEPTADGVVAALSAIPGTTATAPLATTLGDHEATYLELATLDGVPCAPERFYWWQDSPGQVFWGLSEDETLRVWVLDVADSDGRPVVITAREYPDTSESSRIGLEAALGTIVFVE